MKKIILSVLCALITISVHAQLTSEQQAYVANLFAKHGPHALDADVRARLESVRKDLHDFYTTIQRPLLLTARELAKLEQGKQACYKQQLEQVQKEYEELQRPALRTLCERHNMELVSDKHSFVFLLRVKTDWWAIRMRRIGYPISFQTLSRVAYVDAVQHVISEEKLDRIIPPHAFFYNMHGVQAYDEARSQTSFHDDNWLVVERYHAGLPTPDENKKRFHQLSDNDVMLQQLRTLINAVGLWDIAANKLFVSSERFDGVRVPVLRLIDLEMPGLGGAVAENFFQQSDEEVAGNAHVGREELSKLLQRPSWYKKNEHHVLAGAGVIALVVAAYFAGQKNIGQTAS